jgi:hypothetical protein
VVVANLLNSPAAASFSFFQVEQLLGQCASLLERGISSQSEYQSLGEKSFATWLELTEFSALEMIHADETAAGYYTNTAVSSAAESDALTCTSDEYTKAYNVLAPFPTMGNGVGTIDAITTAAQQDAYAGEAQAAQSRLAGATSQAQYDSCDQWFRRRRTEAARRNNLAKLVAYTTVGGAYNYEERRSVLRNRFKEDFGDALARVGAIKAGLSAIYEIPWTMDTLLAPIVPGVPPMAPFDAALLAVRAALEAMSEFGIREQNYILPISLKTLLGAAWSTGFSADAQTGIWDLPIDGSLFPDQAHVRLRGVSATVNVTDPVGLYQAAFNVPAKGAVTFVDGSAPPALDQSTVPLTRIGRVRVANFQHPPDVVGTLSLSNVSPIGFKVPPAGDLMPWRFGITSSQLPLNQAQLTNGPQNLATALPTATQQIDDVTLYLYLAIRSTNT